MLCIFVFIPMTVFIEIQYLILLECLVLSLTTVKETKYC